MASGGDDAEKMKLAGHPPATKMAGGVRVHQHRPRTSESEKEKQKEARHDEKEEAEERVGDSKVVVSGAPTRDEKAFPEAAVRSFHEKPQPTHQQTHNSVNHNIQQPRKQ